MASFFEKLKKGMSIQEPLDDGSETEKETAKRTASSSSPSSRLQLDSVKEEGEKSSTKKLLLAKDKIRAGKAKLTEKKLDVILAPKEQTTNPFPKSEKGKEAEQPRKIDVKPVLAEVKTKSSDTRQETLSAPAILTVAKENWFAEEGELAIDVYQTEKDLVIQSAIAGINPEDINIVIEKDMIYIKGMRKNPIEEKGDYFTKECFWGAFKREIILPVEVDSGFAEATMKEGILTIRLPKILREKKRVIRVKS